MHRVIGTMGTLWGIVGVFGILLIAVYRLAMRAAEALEAGLTSGQWLAAALICVAMAYMEGYRGFQLRFSPRTAARLRYLRDRPDPLRSVLAPFFAMGYFHAKTRTRITAFLLTTMIVGSSTSMTRVPGAASPRSAVLESSHDTAKVSSTPSAATARTARAEIAPAR